MFARLTGLRRCGLTRRTVKMGHMTGTERKSFPELLAAIRPEERGELKHLRPLFEEFMAQTPLPPDRVADRDEP